MPIVFVNLVGGNDGIIFDGASIVADANGKIILQAPPFEEFIGNCRSRLATSPTSVVLPGDDIETIHERARSRHSRLRAQESIYNRGAGFVRRHRLRSCGRAGVRSNRRGKRSERDDAFALLVALEHR